MFNLTNGRTDLLDWRREDDDYLARVCWFGKRLAVQAQSRDQRRLALDVHDPASGVREEVLLEVAATWINLHDNFRPLEDGRFLWTSERTGTSQLCLGEVGGGARRISDLAGRANRIVHADTDQVIFTGWDEVPTEQHVFRLGLDGSPAERLTVVPGWHEAVVSTDGAWMLDRYSSVEQMAATVALAA